MSARKPLNTVMMVLEGEGRIAHGKEGLLNAGDGAISPAIAVADCH